MCGLRAKWQWMINSKENRNRLTERNCLHVTSTAKHILNYWSNCYLQINIGRHFITKCWDDFLSISQRVKCSIDQFCFTFQHSPMITSFVWWLKITVADSLLSLVLLHNGLQQGSCIVPIFAVTAAWRAAEREWKRLLTPWVEAQSSGTAEATLCYSDLVSLGGRRGAEG